MLETSSNQDNRKMSTTAQFSLRTYAGLQWPADSHKARITRLARKLGWGHRRTRSIYNAEQAVSLRADEMAAIQKLTEQRHVEEANRASFQDLQARIARLEAALFQSDEEFHREQMAAFRDASSDGRGDHVARAARLSAAIKTGRGE